MAKERCPWITIITIRIYQVKVTLFLKIKNAVPVYYSAKTNSWIPPPTGGRAGMD